MATLGTFDHELRDVAVFDPSALIVGWFDPELIDAAVAAGGFQAAWARNANVVLTAELVL